MAQSYRDLEIYKLSLRLAIEIHEMSLKLPKFELYEEGSQIRKSSKSIVNNIVEGYARRKYKNEIVHFLTIATAESDETQTHLEIIYKTKSLTDKEKYNYFYEEYRKLGRMLTKFNNSVIKNHISEK